MKTVSLTEGSGRTEVHLAAQWLGNDLIVCFYNGQGHIGATAVAEYHPGEKRASTSVITRFGHKDDAVAYSAAHRLCKSLKIPVCAIAGIHVDNITEAEITEIKENCGRLVEKFLGGQ